MKNDSLHSELYLKKNEYFIQSGQQNHSIGKLLKGVLRGFTLNNAGKEITTHFFVEEDLVSGNYIPNIPATMNIQALEDCLISVANYKKVFSYFNIDNGLTDVVLANFQKLNKQNNSRIANLISGNAMTKYQWFLHEYPNLLNRISHYHIASFLGMTPTQLSRIRKSFSQQM